MSTTALYKQRHLDATIAAADMAYAKHELRGSESRRHYRVGTPGSSKYSFEVVDLHHHAIMVGGDIDYMVFAYHRGSSSKVDWIGLTNDIDYVAEKAVIGLGARSLVFDVDPALAALELEDFVAGRRVGEFFLDDMKSLIRCEGVEAAECALWEYCADDLDGVLPLGLVPSTRVIYAWRALRRLSALIQGAA